MCSQRWAGVRLRLGGLTGDREACAKTGEEGEEGIMLELGDLAIHRGACARKKNKCF